MSWSNVRIFLLRRLARIYPLHLIISVLYLANPVAILFFSTDKNLHGQYDAIYYVLSLFLLHNWGFTDTLDWNVPSWSISTEWLAYLVFPAVIWLTLRISRNAWASGLLVLALAAILALIFSSSIARSIGDLIPQMGAVRCVLEVCMGVGVYYAFRAVPVHAASRLAAVAGLAAIVISATVVADILPDYAAMPLAFAAFVFSISVEGSVFSRFFNGLPLHFVGLISYSTYLVHYFVKSWVKFLLVEDGASATLPFLAYIGAVAVLSALLYFTVEVPGRQFLQRLGAKWVPAPRQAA